MAKLPRIDRASHLRKDTDRLMAALDAPDTRLVPTWRNQTLVSPGGDELAVPTIRQAGGLVDRASELVWLGRLGEQDCFALDLSDLASPLEGSADLGTFSDLRMVGGSLSAEEAELAAYARGILRWHRTHQFCGRCGRRTRPREGGHVRECEADQEKIFPRTDPAVMVLVEHEDKCVLARQPGWPAGMYSVIAGFVEPGETLEAAAARETREELGLDVADIRYQSSQPWPFPASLMLGFRARAKSVEITLGDDELEDARWFSRRELEKPEGFFYPPPYSLAHHLIREFLARG